MEESLHIFHMGGPSSLLLSFSICLSLSLSLFSLFLSFLSCPSLTTGHLRSKFGEVEKERLSYAGYACTCCDHVMYNLDWRMPIVRK